MIKKYEIKNAHFGFHSHFAGYLEVKPLGGSFCVDIVLHKQLVCGKAYAVVFEHCKQVSALKTTVKLQRVTTNHCIVQIVLIFEMLPDGSLL
jgi:hypothetical protein